jgi:hypothetical protein
MSHRAGHWKKKTDDGGCIVTRLNIISWALLTVTANEILVGNSLLHSLMGIVGNDGHICLLGVTMVFL